MKEVTMATLQAATTQTTDPMVLEKEGPATQGEMGPPTPTTPSTKNTP